MPTQPNDLFDVIALLQADQTAQFYPYHGHPELYPPWQQPPATHQYPPFDLDPQTAIPISALAWDEWACGLSAVASVAGIVQLPVQYPTNFGLPSLFPTFRRATFRVLADLKVARAVLHISASPDTIAALNTIPGLLAPDFDYAGDYVLHLTAIPLLVSPLNDIHPHDIAKQALDTLKSQTRLRALTDLHNRYNPTPAREWIWSYEQTELLRLHGITPSGFKAAYPGAQQHAASPALVIQCDGFNRTPDLSRIRAKLAAQKPLTRAETIYIQTIDDVMAEPVNSDTLSPTLSLAITGARALYQANTLQLNRLRFAAVAGSFTVPVPDGETLLEKIDGLTVSLKKDRLWFVTAPETE